MANDKIQIFNNSQFGEIRTTLINNEPWFVGKDVAEALGYANPRKALGDHVDEEDKGVTKCDTLGGNQDVTVINESGLYSLVLSSKLPTAKSFKRWVTSDILPTIRKTGGYVSNEDAFISTYLPLADENTKSMFRTTLQSIRQLNEENSKLQATIAIQNQQITEMQPKASYYDVILQCENAIPINTIAKDYGKYAQWLNQYLHDKGVQYKQGDIWLLYQKYAEKGYTRTKTYVPGTHCFAKVHTYWTQKGRLFIYDLLKADGILPKIEKEDTLHE